MPVLNDEPIYEGTRVRVSANLYDRENNSPASPPQVTLSMRDPAGLMTTPTFMGENPDVPGEWAGTQVVDAPGEWIWVIESSSPFERVIEGRFYVHERSS